MLNKIIFTILGFGLAFVFIPHSAKDNHPQALVSGISTVNAETPSINPTPELAGDLLPPEFTAKSALAWDLESGSVLYSKNLDEKLPIASLTKLMTAIVVMQNANLDEVVTVDRSDQNVVGVSVGLTIGEQLTVKDLLSAMLIPSSNDAALILANYISGSSDKFATLMNDEATKLNLTGTYFSNPVGWDTDDSHSTALDLVKIVREFLKNEELVKIASTKQMQISSVDKTLSHQLTTTNKLLLQNPEVTGLKTGFTSKALGNLAITANHNGRQILTIVLGSTNREDDSEKLLEWVFGAYRW